MYAEFATDAKVQMLSEADQRRYLMLLCLTRTKAVLNDETVGFYLRISAEESLSTKSRLVSAGLITELWEPTSPLETEPERPPAHVWEAIRARIFMRDDYTCRYCGERGGKLECDHVVPVSRGGGHGDENLVTACFACNRAKWARLVCEWRPI